MPPGNHQLLLYLCDVGKESELRVETRQTNETYVVAIEFSCYSIA